MLLPDKETSVDFLNNEAVANTIVSLINTQATDPVTIGVHGDWGAGKSSVLKMIESALNEDKKTSCLWFNGWLFQGFDDAKTVLIEAIITELMIQRSTSAKVKELGTKLLRRVDWLKVARKAAIYGTSVITGIPNLEQVADAKNALNALKDKIAGAEPDEIEDGLIQAAKLLGPGEDTNLPEAVHEFREDFAALLEAAKVERLVVLIDDLDRCLPSTAIDTLEAIRLFLFVPRTAFVIGADEAMIEYAVRSHFPDLPAGSGTPYARNYLEKLIQVPFRIPALGIPETRIYLSLLLVENLVGSDHEGFLELRGKSREGLNRPWLDNEQSLDDFTLVDELRSEELTECFVIAKEIGTILAEGTSGNPRQIKRFLNALLVRQLIADARGFSEEIDQAVLAKLMLAERFQPTFYDIVSNSSAATTSGISSEIATLENLIRNDDEGSNDGKVQPITSPKTPEIEERWGDKNWLLKWAEIEPRLADEDLRPYIFVARDKRIAGLSGSNELAPLLEKLAAGELAARTCEVDVRALNSTDVAIIFTGLKELIQLSTSPNERPNAIYGIQLLVKHHVQYQSQLLDFLASIDPVKLGSWITTGWSECLTETASKDQLSRLVRQWSEQDTNKGLAKAAKLALNPRKGS